MALDEFEAQDALRRTSWLVSGTVGSLLILFLGIMGSFWIGFQAIFLALDGELLDSDMCCILFIGFAASWSFVTLGFLRVLGDVEGATSLALDVAVDIVDED